MDREALEAYKALLDWMRKEMELDAFSGATKARLVAVLKKINQ